MALTSGLPSYDAVDHDLAADGGHADAVAVPADAADDALREVSRAGRVERAEAQAVEQGDGSRTHGEDVAQDAADAGRGTLEGLDRAGMVVALDLHDDGVAVADVDRAGVLLAGADQHARARRWGSACSSGRECW